MRDSDEIKAQLQRIVLGRTSGPGSFTTTIEGVSLHRRDAITSPENCLYLPRIIKIVQGRKRSVVGGDEYFYHEDNVFVAGVDMPNTSSIFEASPENPCMSITVDIDKELVAQLSLEMPDIPPNDDDESNGLLVQPADPDMLDAFLRLMELLDKPELIPVMGPMLIKEIHYRVLMGVGGDKLRLFYTFGSQRNQVAKAITWLRENFMEHITVEDLADKVHMASSTFYRRFKETATVSPLQFQKRLRLHEAQRLMLMDKLDAGSACEVVGYESLTQFNREYKRLFGEPPLRNVNRWRREHILTPAVVPGE